MILKNSISCSGSRRRAFPVPRGMGMLEVMASSAIMLIGLMGVFQTIAVASNQNALAGRMTRAVALSNATRVGLENKFQTGRIAEVWGVSDANCTSADAAGTSSRLSARTAGLHTQKMNNAGPCVVDLDLVEKVNTAGDQTRLVPGYFGSDADTSFDRVLIRFPADDNGYRVVAIVVTWAPNGKDPSELTTHKQFIGFYDSTINQTRINL